MFLKHYNVDAVKFNKMYDFMKWWILLLKLY